MGNDRDLAAGHRRASAGIARHAGRWRLRATQGRPVPGVELRIVGDAGNELPHDGEAVGELQVRGPWITGSYIGEEDDGEKFQDGWLRTGDVGRIDERSFVTLTDRTRT